MLELRGVTAGYGRTRVLEDVDVVVEQGGAAHALTACQVVELDLEQEGVIGQ